MSWIYKLRFWKVFNPLIFGLREKKKQTETLGTSRHFLSLLPTPQEEELRASGDPKYAHLEEDLHVLIEVEAPPGQAHARLGLAIEEIKKFLVPVSIMFKSVGELGNWCRQRLLGALWKYKAEEGGSLATLWTGTSPSSSHQPSLSHWRNFCGKSCLKQYLLWPNSNEGWKGLGAELGK